MNAFFGFGFLLALRVLGLGLAGLTVVFVGDDSFALLVTLLIAFLGNDNDDVVESARRSFAPRCSVGNASMWIGRVVKACLPKKDSIVRGATEQHTAGRE
jgi:hypothetical protein